MRTDLTSANSVDLFRHFVAHNTIMTIALKREFELKAALKPEGARATDQLARRSAVRAELRGVVGCAGRGGRGGGALGRLLLRTRLPLPLQNAPDRLGQPQRASFSALGGCHKGCCA